MQNQQDQPTPPNQAKKRKITAKVQVAIPKTEQHIVTEIGGAYGVGKYDLRGRRKETIYKRKPQSGDKS